MHANLVEHNPNPVLQLDAEGRVQYANPAAHAILDGRAAPDWASAAWKVLELRQAVRLEHAERLPPMRITHAVPGGVYEFTLLPDPDSAGFLAFGRDISAQRHLESAQRLSEERFRLASRAAPGLLYDYDFTANAVYRSQGLAQLIGLEPGDVDATVDGWLDRVHPDDVASIQATVDGMKNGETDSLASEYRVRHADGHWVTVWDRGYILRDEQGKPLRLVGMTTDITARKLREQKAAFLGSLAAGLAEMNDAAQVADYLSRAVGEHLQVDRCIITEIEADQRWVTADYAPKLPPLNGELQVHPLPEALRNIYLQERQAVVEDIKTSIAAFPGVEAAIPEWLGALVITPRYRDGKRVGAVTVVSVKPRRWQADELDLLNQAGNLFWLALEKIRLQARARWGEQVFIRLLEEIPAGIAYLTGPEHRFALVNHAYRRIAAGRGELVGRTVAEVWPEVAADWLLILDDVYTTGESFYREDLTARILRNGQELEAHFLTACMLTTDEDGEVIGLLLMMQEITEQVRGKHEIQEERARLKALIEHAPVGVVLTDSEGQIILANPAAQHLNARPTPMAQPLESHGAMQLCYPDGRPYAPRDLPLTRSALEGQVTINLDMLIAWPDGQRRPLLVSTAPVRSADGKLIGAVGMFQDISERAELRDRLAYQAQVLETVHDAIFAVDAGNLITSWNQAAEALYGWTAEEMIGSDQWEQRILPAEAPADPDERLAVQARLEQGEVITVERTHCNRRGERLYVELTLSAMRSDAGELRGYVTSIRDMTARHKAELALRRYATRLERSNRDLEDFAFIASHDMQEPLRKVRAFGELLLNGYRSQLDERGSDYVDRMVNAAVRMQRMLESLLAYSRVATRGQPFESVDLNAAAAAALENLEARLKTTGGQVEVGALPTIQGDPQQMQQIFQNLIGNGLKFHAPNTPPRVSVESRELPDGWVELTVSDNGVGFSMEFSDRLFQPFQRLHGRSAFEGSGVGLAICRKIVERHGGTIRGFSAPGEGARFMILLPVKQAAIHETRLAPGERLEDDDASLVQAGEPV